MPRAADNPRLCGDDDNKPEGPEDPENTCVVTTGAEIVRPCWVTLSGEVKAGVRWWKRDLNSRPTIASKLYAEVGTQIVSGQYTAEVKGILDQFTYYYRSYAVINGEYLYGKISHFTTPEFTYEVDGKTYQMI